MKPKELAELAVAMNDITTMKDDIKEIKDSLAAFIKGYNADKDSLSKKFITRAEAVAIGTAFGVVITLVTLWINLKDTFK